MSLKSPYIVELLNKADSLFESTKTIYMRKWYPSLIFRKRINKFTIIWTSIMATLSFILGLIFLPINLTISIILLVSTAFFIYIPVNATYGGDMWMKINLKNRHLITARVNVPLDEVKYLQIEHRIFHYTRNWYKKSKIDLSTDADYGSEGREVRKIDIYALILQSHNPNYDFPVFYYYTNDRAQVKDLGKKLSKVLSFYCMENIPFLELECEASKQYHRFKWFDFNFEAVPGWYIL